MYPPDLEAQNRAANALGYVHRHAMGSLPRDGSLVMNPSTFAVIVRDMPVQFMLTDWLGENPVSVYDGGRLMGCTVILDNAMPVNEIRYRVEQAVVVNLVQEEAQDGT